MSGGLQLSETPTQAPVRSETRTRPSKVSKWDRPAPPKDWRYFVGGLGKILIALGLLTFGFVAYQLWGTGFETSRAQNELENSFEQSIQFATGDADTVTTTPAEETTGTQPTGPKEIVIPKDPAITEVASADEQQALTKVPDGAIMKMEIPKIDLSYYIVGGIGREDLKAGIGHFPMTPWAGQLGNAAFAGHRTTYNGPFYHLDKLEPGDRIFVTRIDGNRYSYEVTDTEVVTPDNVDVLGGDPLEATILLQTCTPIHSASHRLIIHGKLVPSESDQVGVATFYDQPAPVATTPPPATTAAPTTAAPTTVPATTLQRDPSTPTTEAGEFVPRTTVAPTTAPAPATTAPAPPTTVITSAGLDEEAAGIVDDESANGGWDRGWFDDRAAIPQVAMWAGVLLAIYAASRLISRWTRHDSVGFVVAVAPFLVCLYFFYENVNRLLPAGI